MWRVSQTLRVPIDRAELEKLISMPVFGPCQRDDSNDARLRLLVALKQRRVRRRIVSSKAVWKQVHSSILSAVGALAQVRLG